MMRVKKCLTIQLAVEAEQNYLASLSPEARERNLAKQKKDNEEFNVIFKAAREKMKLNNNRNEGELKY